MLLFRLDNISKSYDKDPVLEKASLSIRSGSIHSILGINGSGKSTLARILSGIVVPDSGTLYFQEEPIEWNSPAHARKNGVATVNMSYELVDNLMVCENIYVFGYAYKTKRRKRCTLQKMATLAREVFDDLGFDVDPYAYPNELDLKQSLMVQIAMVVSQEPKAIILDNPFFLLNKEEFKDFHDVFQKLKAKGMTVVYTTSDIEAAMMFSDEITIIKEHNISTYDVADKDASFFSAAMSDTLSYRYPRIKSRGKKEYLRVHNLSTANDAIRDISFSIYEGEILGIAGPVGAGRSTLAKALYGLERIKRGSIYIENEEEYITCPQDAIKCGMGFMQDSTNDCGAIDDFSVTENITLANLSGVSDTFFINKMKELEIGLRFIKNYSIRPSDIDQDMRMLTVGNKQKAMFCKWIFKDCRLIIMDKITKGIETSNKVEMYNFMNRFAMSGGSILFISDDYNELVGMCDRVIVMNGGRIRDVLLGENVTMRNVVDGVSGIGRSMQIE